MQPLLDALGRDGVGMLGGFIVIGVMVISIVAIIQWRKLRQAEMQTALKHEMLQRGMSAAEFVQVLTASPTTNQPCDRQPLAETADYKAEAHG